MYMGSLILGVNALYRLFCLFPMVSKGLILGINEIFCLFSPLLHKQL